MNKKIIIAGIAILSMTAIISQQANASMDKTGENRGKMEQQRERSNSWLHLGSCRNEMRSGLKLWSGEREHLWSWKKEMWSGLKLWSGNMMWSGEKRDFLGTGKAIHLEKKIASIKKATLTKKENKNTIKKINKKIAKKIIKK